MAIEGREGNIKCPVLLTAGEYDARSPVELVYNFYDNITAPKELWVYEDMYHWTNLFGGSNEHQDCHSMGMGLDGRGAGRASMAKAMRATSSCVRAAAARTAPRARARARCAGGRSKQRFPVHIGPGCLIRFRENLILKKDRHRAVSL